MKKKRIKRKGYTLLEVILSVALIALLLIPISNMIMTAMKSNKRADIRQDGAVVGQQLLEELKTYDNFSTSTPNFTLLDGTTLTLATSTPEKSEYEGIIRDGNQRYEVNVLVEKDENFVNYKAATTTPTSIPDAQYTCIIKLSTENGLNYINLNVENDSDKKEIPVYGANDSRLLLDINKSGTSLDLTLEDYGQNVYHSVMGNKTITDANKVTFNRIKVELSDSFTGDIPIIINNNSQDIVFDVIKPKNTTGEVTLTSASGKVFVNNATKTANVATFTARKNIKIQDTGDTTITGDLYKITVVVKNNGDEIFRSEVSNNLD
ncbi:MAG: type II secretion system protein [Clostridium sp.]|nr:type II secretion system protein [Clostridium sp.]